MKYFALILFISLISINLFGFVIFNYDMNHVEGGCVASIVEGETCPLNMMDFAIHKISVIKVFSTTLISSYYNLPIILSILTFSFLFFLFQKKLKYFKINLFSEKQRKRSVNFYNNKLKINNWLSLLENSPAI